MVGDMTIKNLIQVGLSCHSCWELRAHSPPATSRRTSLAAHPSGQTTRPLLRPSCSLAKRWITARPDGHICSASILTEDTLVTAAHCVAEDINNPTDPFEIVHRLWPNLAPGATFGQPLPQGFTGNEYLRPINNYAYDPGWTGNIITSPTRMTSRSFIFPGGLPQGFSAGEYPSGQLSAHYRRSQSPSRATASPLPRTRLAPRPARSAR